MSERVSLKDRIGGPEKDGALSTEKKAVPCSSVSSAHDTPFFQTTIGNRALYGLFKSGILQPKLRIGRPNDVYEQEADRVAEQVMKMPGETVDSQQSAVGKGRGTIQRKPG